MDKESRHDKHVNPKVLSFARSLLVPKIQQNQSQLTTDATWLPEILRPLARVNGQLPDWSNSNNLKSNCLIW